MYISNNSVNRSIKTIIFAKSVWHNKRVLKRHTQHLEIWTGTLVYYYCCCSWKEEQYQINRASYFGHWYTYPVLYHYFLFMAVPVRSLSREHFYHLSKSGVSTWQAVGWIHHMQTTHPSSMKGKNITKRCTCFLVIVAYHCLLIANISLLI